MNENGKYAIRIPDNGSRGKGNGRFLSFKRMAGVRMLLFCIKKCENTNKTHPKLGQTLPKRAKCCCF